MILLHLLIKIGLKNGGKKKNYLNDLEELTIKKKVLNIGKKTYKLKIDGRFVI